MDGITRVGWRSLSEHHCMSTELGMAPHQLVEGDVHDDAVDEALEQLHLRMAVAGSVRYVACIPHCCSGKAFDSAARPGPGAAFQLLTQLAAAQPTSALMTVTSPTSYGASALPCSATSTACSRAAQLSLSAAAASGEQKIERSMSPSGRYVLSGTEPNM